MKIKALIMMTVLALSVFLISGCTDKTNDNTGNDTSNSTSQDTSQENNDEGDDNNGEYDNEDGFFNDTDEDTENSAGDDNDNADSLGDNADNSSDSEDTDPVAVEDDLVIAAAHISAGAEDLRSTLIGWGLGKERDSLNRPLDALNAQEEYGEYSSLFIDESGSKTVYLTFDEGYENGYTGAILDTLKKAGVKATFFVTYDYCVSSPDLVERMIAEGHTVGNHSYTHPSLPSCSEEEVTDEVMILHDYVKENFGYEMMLFRFPMGEFSEKTLYQLQSLGYTSVFWSFAYQDWNVDQQMEASEAFDTITSSTHNGGIYLLHAVSKANSDCLGDVIDYWKNNGYTIGDLNSLAAG